MDQELFRWKCWSIRTRKFLILLLITLILPACSTKREAAIGGGWLHPHSSDSTHSLDQGYSIIGSVDQNLWENETDWIELKGELLFIYSEYAESERESRHSEPDSQFDKHTFTAGTLLKLDIKLVDEWRMNTFIGPGFDVSDSLAPSLVIGGGVDYWFSKDWAVGPVFIYTDNHEKTYTLPAVMLRMRYDF